MELPFTYDWLRRDNPAMNVLSAEKEIEMAASFCFYRRGDKFTNIILNIKFKHQQLAAKQLGQWFAREVKENGVGLDAIDLIIPMPLHKFRLWWRGYNQTYCIAEGIEKVFNAPICCDAVIRSVHTKVQSKMKGRWLRIQNTENIFKVVDSKKLEGKHILLIDDVLTTGATLRSLIRCITESTDNCKISVLTLSRTEKRVDRQF
ncbi:MAG: phosphoribosyltransferase family protein [Rikenellaceae bacterium]